MNTTTIQLFSKLTLVFICTLFTFGSVFASHIAGGDITYSCVGPNQYQVTLTLYRDCNGMDLANTESISYRSANCGVNATLALSLQSESDITPLCPSVQSACNGGSGNLGIERFIYTGILNLPPGCTDWILSYQMCCRNGSITNLNTASSQDFYIQTTLNNTIVPCNSSPYFTNIPQTFACVGETINFQQLAVDPDGDVLVYSLVNGMNAPGSGVTYAGGFNGANPFTVPLTINSSTGEITFTPNIPQVAVVAVLVEEYRAGVLIGSVMRDIQFNIVNCTNAIPDLGGINGVPNVFTISSCVGTQLCFNVNATDSDAGQNVTMTASNSIIGSTFTTSGSGTNMNGTFCWTPTSSDVGTHYIIINAEDDACPLIGQNSKTYEIIIVPNPNAPVNAGADITICEGNSATLTATTSATNASSYSWTPTNGLETPNNASTVVTPTSTTNYTVTLNYTDGCTSTDQVLVTVAADPVATLFPATGNVCPGGSFMLSGSTNTTGMNFEWFDPSMASLGTGTVSGTNSSLLVNVPVAPGSYVYTLNVTNPITGCFSTTTSTLVVGAPPALPSCVNIYVSPGGLASSPGTQAFPTSLANALAISACNNAVIKLAAGTYSISNPLTIGSYVTIEGGFNPTTWEKISTAGVTTINRTTANPEGTANAQRLVAFYGNSATGFRFQDVTITTSNANQPGMSTYGIHLTNCSNYNFVRTQVLPGAAAAGAGDINPATYHSTWDGANGANGANGITGGGPQCTCNFGTDNGGNGGNGGGAGAGGANAIVIGGNGGNGGNGGIGGNGRPDNTSAAGFNGAAGTTAIGGGAGGAGGAGGNQDSNGSSTSNVGNGATGGIGLSGTNGTTIASTYVGGFFIPGSGTNGTAGRGGGGGGGGGGAARDTDGCDAAGGGGSGGGGGGGGGGAGRGGFGGGASFGIFLLNNAANGNIIQSNITAGAAGTGGAGGRGGNGGNGGTSVIGNGCTNGDTDGNRGGDGGNGGAGGVGGNGGNGPNGVSINVHLASGTGLSTNVNSFNLAAQPTITVSNVNCTNTNVTYTTGTPAAWDFDLTTNFATPATAGAISPAVTQYSQIGRYSVSMGANTYTGFHNIAFSGTTDPGILTNALEIATDTFQVCQGQFANFQSENFADTYIWNFNGAIVNPGNVASLNAQFNTPGIYTIALNIITDCCGTSPTSTVYLVVLANPIATGSGNIAICAEESTILTLTGLQASDSVVWSPTTAISGSTTNSITVNPASTTTYIATIYSTATIGSLTAVGCPINVNFVVTVNQTPVMNLTSTSVACSNDGTATATVSSPGLYNFSWSNGGSTVNATTSTISGLANGVYTVTATNVATGCSITDSIYVYPSPTQPYLYVQNNVPTCTGLSNGSVLVNTSGGTAQFTYLWNGVSTVVSSNSMLQDNLSGGIYSVTVTDNNGCASNLLVNIPELELPSYSITNNGVICAGGDAIFTIEGSDGTVLTYDINGVTSTIVLSHHSQDIIIPNATTDQIMNLISMDGNCVVPIGIPEIIVVDPCGLPIELISFNGICEGRETYFYWSTNSESDNDYFTLEQSKNGLEFTGIKTIDGAGNSTSLLHYDVTITQSEEEYTYYRLKQTDFNGDSEYSDIIHIACSDNSEEVLLFPNPTNSVINIDLKEEVEGDFTVKIYDLLGKEVKSVNYYKEKKLNITLKISDLINGQYFVKVQRNQDGKNYPVMKFTFLR